MEVWALANQKGGCGKTTTAVNLAAALAHRGEEVLLIDLDPQAHATLALGHAAGVGPSMAQVFLDDAPLVSAVRQAPGGFSLCPSSTALAEYETLAARRLNAESVLARAIGAVRDRYGWVLVDCPPRADGVLTANAVRAATGVCLVVETGAFALQGALRARSLLARLHADLEPGPVYRVLATMYDRRTRFARDVLVGMHARFEGELFDIAVRESVQLREAAAFGLPARELEPDGRAARDFDALAREFLALSGARRAEPARREPAAGEVPAPPPAPRVEVPDPSPISTR